MKCATYFVWNPAILLVAGMTTAAEWNFEHVVIDAQPPRNPWSKMVGDFNGDARPDIAIAGQNGPLVWYVNPTWKKVKVAEGGWQTVAGVAADLDGDGDTDLVPGAQVWFENPAPNGDPARDSWPSHSISSIRTHDVGVADLDGDGRLDLVARDQSGFGHNTGNRVHFWRQADLDQWEHSAFECPHGEGLALADFDRDGDPDIVLGGLWFENPGRIKEDWPRHVYTSEWSWADAKVAVGDLNGDGRVDVALAPAEFQGQTYRIAWYEAPEDPRQSDWQERVVVAPIESVIHGMQLADMDGDGHLDIVAAQMHQGEAPRNVAVFRNEDRGARWSRHVVATTGSHDIQVADFDGDGRPDILGANHGGAHQPVELWLNRSFRKQTAGWEKPQPGDLFREYRWTHAEGDAGGSLRVGGRLDYGGGPIVPDHELDLQHATRAEVVIEKLLCHDGTRGLAISVNSNAWINVPEAPGIPSPQWDYQHHTYPVTRVPLEHLRPGPNSFRLRVGDEHPWNWPQHLIYGVHFRIYYDASAKPHPTGRLVEPQSGEALKTQVSLAAEASSPNGPIRQVDFIGHYTDVNLEGDGDYTQWHYHYVRGELEGHLGSATAAPWRTTWNTSWVPDQAQPIRLAARITDATGLTYVTEAIEELTLARNELSVELCKPYDVPERWVTRSGEKTQKFRITGDLDRAVAAQLVWVSWSPGYMNGLFLNGQRVFDSEGPRYAYYSHRVTLTDLSALRPGENTLTTGLTPKHNGQMVHGMEVNWPGIMVLIQYRP